MRTHYLQYNALTITGATHNTTIAILTLQKQYDYFLNLQYQFIHYLQNNTITDANYIYILTLKTISNKIKDTCILIN